MKFVKRCLVLFMVLISHLVQAQIPETISYQGTLTDEGSQPAANGEYSMTFRLYTVEVGGTSIWNETQTVTVIDGIFNSILGSNTPLDLPFDVKYWLGVTIDSGDELSPRIELASSAYSLNAKQVKGIGNIFPSDGRVGIGTSSPGYKLEVHESETGGTDTWTKGILVRNSNEESGEPAIAFSNYATGSNYWIMGCNQRPEFDVAYGDHFGDNTTKFTILPEGEVGIGITNPAYKLDVVGDINFSGSLYQNGSPFGEASLWSQNGSNIYYNDGRVGIGTADPGRLLHVRGSDILEFEIEETNPGSAAHMYLRNPTRSWLIMSDSDPDLFIIQDETQFLDRLVIDNNGNVGIGTSSPDEKLDIDGNQYVTGYIDGPEISGLNQVTIGKGNVGTSLVINDITNAKYRIHTGTFDLRFDQDQSGVWEPRMTIENGGNIGIGTTDPAEKLEVAGVIRVTGLTSAAAATDVNIDTDGNLFKVSSSKRYKKDIQNVKLNKDNILSLRPVQFKWKTTDQSDIGLIAEEVEKIIPNLVVKENNGQCESVKYSQLSVYLLDVIKKQQTELDELNSKYDEVLRELKSIKKDFASL